MSNDAKLGLLLGVAIVLVIALVFFRSDTVDARLPTPAAKKAEASPQAQIAQP